MHLINHSYVFVVLEHADEDIMSDARVHGVYTTRAEADRKTSKIANQELAIGYLSVLKKPIKGIGIEKLKIDKNAEWFELYINAQVDSFKTKLGASQ